MKVNKVILFFVIIFCGFYFLGLKGCSVKNKDESTSDKIVIKVACWGTPEELDIITKAVDEWQKSSDRNIKVVLEHVNYNGYVSKILTRIAGGSPPDIIATEVDIFADFFSKGAFLSLTPFLKDDKNFSIDKYFPEVLDRFTINNELYCIPKDIAPFACIYYNKDIFDEAGIPYPSDDWTLSDMLEIAKKLTKREDGYVKRFGFYSWAWQNFVYSCGGDLVDDVKNPTKCTLASENSIKGLQFYVDLVAKHKVTPSPTDLTNMGTQVTQMFMSQKLAMFNSGIWETPLFRKITDFDWDIAMFPKGDNGVRGFGTGGSGYCILKTTKNPKEAWEVLKILGGEYGQVHFAEGGLCQPARIDIAMGIHFAQSPKLPKNKGMLNQAVKYIKYNPFHQNWKKINDLYVNPELDLIYSERESVEEGVKKIAENADKLLKEI